MEEEFRLIYRHKESGKEFRAKRVIKDHYVLLDPETNEKTRISKWKLDKEYEWDKGNKLPGKKSLLNFKKRSA